MNLHKQIRGSGMNAFMENISGKHQAQFRCTDPGSRINVLFVLGFMYDSLFPTHLPPGLKMLVAQLYPTLCDHMECSPPGSSVHQVF